ncbi:P-loop containing nucleoside triphosphate hydrolase protein [Cadophora sp. MPI-SDFR-AT-0126]|nr:P-loop containing nucleoside triphosphate hydrolase protein [Leotiomycetes sp. MPI-SDFR-AT-0126]
MLVPRWNDNHSQSFVNPVSHQPRHLSTSALRQTRSSTSPYSLHPTIRDSQLSQIQNKLPALADPEEFPSLPGQSNAVPIRQPQPPVGDHVIPSWAQEQPVRSLLPVRYTPEIRAPSSTSHDGKSSGSSESQHNTPTESSGHELNVFARPFVSEALLVINELNGQIFDTAGVKEINFEIYVGRCLGWDFLPIIPRPITPPVLASSDLASLELTDALTDRSYEYYFRAHLEAEIESQKAENETYALYEHDIQNPTVNQHGCTTCSIRIPGLRENSPYIEEDDIIQLRELIYDRYNRLLGMDSELAPGWTGIIYNARVLAVQRKHNILVIRIDDSPHIRGWIRSSPRFNIQFPVPMKRYQPMKDVLPIIQEVLKQANRARYPIAGRSANQPFTSYSKPSTDAGNNFKVTNPPITPWIQSMLFPVESDCDTQTKLNPGRFKQAFFDNQLNWEQKKAIESICSRNYGTLPFLISGPPGTGKTKTLVEVALQLVKRSDGVSHVLFCAPSDPAADMIVQRLSSHFNTNELLRLNRSSRSFAEVPGGVLPFCCICEDRFDLPKFQQIMACKLVVTTCRDASLLLYSRLSNVDLVAAEYGLRCAINPDATPPAIVDLHWTAVLIDEAAQSMEPEALIPLSIVAPPLGSAKLASQPLVIMAGDENQFGPRTSLASSPLKTSLFARLFARQVYSEHPLSRGKSGERQPKTLQQTMLPIARPAFANLIRNYRSHPAILAVPSSRFYFDTLEPEAADTHCLVSWSGWRGRKWPVLFHKNESEDSMDLENGGWSNAGEAQLACEYAASLVKSGLVAQKDICIMSPFKAQVARLRSIARDPRFALWDVDIGPTEAFQGLERSVVILCTTRSKQLFVASDVASNQGIINLPKSMNVALTRAKFGLIVIGRRNVLKSDPNWRAFVEFCERNGLVAGDEDEDGDEDDKNDND